MTDPEAERTADSCSKARQLRQGWRAWKLWLQQWGQPKAAANCRAVRHHHFVCKLHAIQVYIFTTVVFLRVMLPLHVCNLICTHASLNAMHVDVADVLHSTHSHSKSMPPSAVGVSSPIHMKTWLVEQATQLPNSVVCCCLCSIAKGKMLLSCNYTFAC